MDTREVIYYDESSDKLLLNMLVIKMVDEYNDLWEYRQKNPLKNANSDEDASLSEFKMIWWIGHPASPGFKSGASITELLGEARAKFSPIGWRETTVFKDALDAYIQDMLNTNPIYALIRSHVSGMRTSGKSINRMADTLEQYSLSIKIDLRDEDSIKSVSHAQMLIKTMNDDAATVAKRIKTFNDLEQAFGEQEERIQQIYGGKPYSISLDPNNDIEKDL